MREYNKATEARELQRKTENEEDFVNTTQGKRFLRSLDLSKEFLHKHERKGKGLYVSEVGYLADKCLSGYPIAALLDMYAYASRIGYKTAQRDAKGAQKAK